MKSRLLHVDCLSGVLLKFYMDFYSLLYPDIYYFVIFTSFYTVVISSYLIYLTLLLVLSGDIELNPGPASHYRKDNCRILYSNIRGLRTNFLDLQCLAQGYDLMFLTETLVLSNRDKSEFLIPGFNGPEFIYRRSIPHAQGMAVYSRSGQPLYRQKSLECNCHEILCFKVYSKFYNVYIFALYRNPNHDDSIYDCISERIAMAQSQDSKASFVICGDCNAKHRDWLNSSITDQHGRSALEFSVSSACEQLISEPTHKDGNTLDLVFTDVPAIVEAKVSEFVGTSDHCSLSISVRVNQRIPSATIEKRIWLKSRANWDAIEQEFAALNISDIIRNPSPIAKLNEMMLFIVERHIPRRVIKIRTSDKPWFNENCRRAQQNKQTKFNIWRRNRSHENWNAFAQARREANGVYHNAEKNYHNSQKTKLEQINQPHLWWTKLKSSIFGSNNSSLPPLLKPDGTLTTIPKEKAELLHQVFDAKQSDEAILLPLTCHREPLLTRFAFRSRDLKNILDNLDSWGGEDPDGFFPLLHKKVSKSLAPKLSRFYRFLFRRGSFPDDRKLCNTVPIPKCGMSAIGTNYRPISILPVLSKVAEKLIFKPLYRYLESNKLLPARHYAYRKKLGTCDALLDLTCGMQHDLDNGFETRIVQLDFSAAFDLVNHKALIFKLKGLGIGGWVLDLLECFLTDRKQRVVVDGVYSDVKPIRSGVPQGSVLGPLLFLAYISDMDIGLENDLIGYADDHTLKAVVRSPQHRSEVAQSLNRDLERISVWCSAWGMKLNSSKTKSMLVSRSRTAQPPHPQLFIGDTALVESPDLT
ncbi:MAG: reverse transcriptase family protein, partial [Cyanobacteria bacterium J06582_2]